MNNLKVKNILYVSPFDEPLSGADESLVLLIAQLKKTTPHLFHVLLPKNSKYIESYRNAGARVHLFALSRLKRSFSPLYWIHTFFKGCIELIYLPFFYKKHAIDLVHLNMHVCFGPHLSAFISQIPVVVHYRAKTKDTPKWFFDLYLRFIHAISKKLICISQSVENHFSKRNLNGKTSVIYNPIDSVFFSNLPLTNPYPAPSQVHTLLFLGRLHPQKKVDVLIQAFKYLNPAKYRLMIVGSAAPSEKAYEKALIEEAQGINVIFYGKQTNVVPFLKHAEVLILPSINEGFGRVLIEAFASQTKVIGANSGAIPEVLGNGKWGTLFEPDDAQHLKTVIEKVCREPLSPEVFEHAQKNFSIEMHAKLILELYASLLNA